MRNITSRRDLFCDFWAQVRIVHVFDEELAGTFFIWLPVAPVLIESVNFLPYFLQFLFQYFMTLVFRPCLERDPINRMLGLALFSISQIHHNIGFNQLKGGLKSDLRNLFV